jgi:hypothetical protein
VRQVLATIDRSLFESARIALAAEEIEVFVANDNVAVPFMPLTLSVVHDDDFERAVVVVKALEPRAATDVPRRAGSRRFSWVIFLILLGAVIWVCGLVF